MQHVQSQYADPSSVLNLDEQQVTRTQRMVPDKAWLTQLTTPAFMPLVDLSPESSTSSVGQDFVHGDRRDSYVT